MPTRLLCSYSGAFSGCFDAGSSGGCIAAVAVCPSIAATDGCIEGVANGRLCGTNATSATSPQSELAVLTCGAAVVAGAARARCFTFTFRLDGNTGSTSTTSVGIGHIVAATYRSVDLGASRGLCRTIAIGRGTISNNTLAEFARFTV